MDAKCAKDLTDPSRAQIPRSAFPLALICSDYDRMTEICASELALWGVFAVRFSLKKREARAE